MKDLKTLFILIACKTYRILQNVPGVWRFRSNLKTIVKRNFTAHYPIITKLKNGSKIKVDLCDHHGPLIFLDGFYEKGTSNLFKDILKKGDAVLDIGASIGYFSLLSSELVAKQGVIYAFEASKKVFDDLNSNIKLNELSNVKTYNVAVSDVVGFVEFNEVTENNSGLSSIRKLMDVNSEVVRTPCITIDSMISELKRPINLVKIDVEGAEFNVLKGMQKLLVEDKPFIILELTDSFLKEMQSSAEEVCSMLLSLGYDIKKIEYGGVTPLDLLPGEQVNVLASPRL